MKKNIFAVWMLVCMILQYHSSGQVGSHYQFKGPLDDHFRAATLEIGNTYYAVGNTNSYDQVNKILLCKLNSNGTLVWSKTISASATQGQLIYSATDIQAGYNILMPSDDSSWSGIVPITTAPDQNSFNYLYISGSTTDPVTGAQNMLLVKVDANGNVIWARSNFLPADGSVTAEYGISVESAPDGGAFLVGTAMLNGGASAVSVARFDANGKLRWHNRYKDAAVSPGQLIPKQSCIVKEQVSPYPAALAITGLYKPTGSTYNRTFVMRIAHGGNELFLRGAYPSGILQNNMPVGDEGDDIVPDPVLSGGNISNFVVSGTIGFNSLYLLRVNVNGLFTNGYQIKPPLTQKFTAISLVPTATNDVAVSGIYDDNSFNLRTYLMQVSQSTGVVSGCKTYNDTKPLGNEHISRRVSGFILATTQIGTAQDAMAITLDGTGAENPTCKEVAVSTSNITAGSRTALDTISNRDTTVAEVYPGPTDVSEPNDSCIYVDPPPFNCSQCVDSFRYRQCCCSNKNGSITYTVCFRFDTTICWNKTNWNITVNFGDGSSTTFTKADSVCHTFTGPGMYKVCYTLTGYFFNGVSWSLCSAQRCQWIMVAPCGTNLPPCTAVKCTPPPPFTEAKPQVTAVEALHAAIQDVTIQPNPLDGHMNAIVSFELLSHENLSILLVDVNGKILYSQAVAFDKGKHMVNLPAYNLAKGIYFVKVITQKNTQTLRLVND